jgi:hypothetical protein
VKFSPELRDRLAAFIQTFKLRLPDRQAFVGHKVLLSPSRDQIGKTSAQLDKATNHDIARFWIRHS